MHGGEKIVATLAGSQSTFIPQNFTFLSFFTPRLGTIAVHHDFA
jgi:hypothetical protein